MTASQLPSDRSALATTVSRGGYSRGGSTSEGVGRSSYGRGGSSRGGFSRGIGRGSSRGGPTPGGGGQGRGRVLRHCSWCNADNHTIDYCWDLHGRPSAHQVTVSEDDGSQVSSSSASRVVTIPEDEYQPFQHYRSTQTFASTAMLAQKGPPSAYLASHTPWVIDSGASDHMTGVSTVISHCRPSGTSSRVTLANGSTTQIASLGSVTLNPSISLDTVLHVPRFPFSLLSVSKITNALNCLVTFFPNSCVFQDLKTRRKIGGGAERGGLYSFLDAEQTTSIAFQSIVSPYQYHCRLGHPSL